MKIAGLKTGDGKVVNLNLHKGHWSMVFRLETDFPVVQPLNKFTISISKFTISICSAVYFQITYWIN